MNPFKPGRIAGHVGLFILIAFAFVAEGIDITSTTGVLAYTLDLSCPTGWTDLSFDATYKGRYIKGYDNVDTSGFGEQFGTAQADGVAPKHVHSKWSQILPFDDSQQSTWSTTVVSRTVQKDSVLTATQSNGGTLDDADSGIPRKRAYQTVLPRALDGY
jgi:hypothetical protein